MRSKSFFLSILVFFVPFLFAVNILRMQLGGDDGTFLSFTGFLQYASEIDFSFSGTYVAIAYAGEAWRVVIDSDPDIFRLLGALWLTVSVPVQMLMDFIGGVYDCVLVFVKFVGSLPQ